MKRSSLLVGLAVVSVCTLRVASEPVPADLGSKIAFTSLRDDVTILGSDERLEAEIWVMNGDGSEPRRLTYNDTDDLGAMWSPDGKTIAFYGTRFGRRADGQIVAIDVHMCFWWMSRAACKRC